MSPGAVPRRHSSLRSRPNPRHCLGRPGKLDFCNFELGVCKGGGILACFLACHAHDDSILSWRLEIRDMALCIGETVLMALRGDQRRPNYIRRFASITPPYPLCIHDCVSNMMIWWWFQVIRVHKKGANAKSAPTRTSGRAG